MLNQYLSEFSEAWIEKADSYTDADLKSTFDKFFSLFVVYNALYNEAANRLIARNSIKPNQGTDLKSATAHVPSYIGYESLAETLKSPDCHPAINAVTCLIREGVFYICCKKSTGAPDHAEDKKHIDKIETGSPQEFCEALLTLLYKTRCNMFHGSKEFKHIQIEILAPMNIILRCLVVKLHSSLMENA